MYGWPLSGAEILLCYSILDHIFPDKSAWPCLDSILDSLLPDSLPLKMVDSIAPSTSRLGKMYDVQLVGDNNKNHGDRCYLQGKAPTMTLDWKYGYVQGNNTTVFLDALEISKGKALSDNVITSVAMGYRKHLEKNLIHIMGDKLVLFKPINMQ